MAEPILRRYYLPSEKPLEGWAEIVIGSNGFFAAVSDYGNYAYAWRDFDEKDFRKFVISLEKSWRYAGEKFNYGKMHQFSTEKTAKFIHECILEARRPGDISKKNARTEWNLAQDLEHGDISFEDWGNRTSYFRDEPWTFACHEPSADILAFCTKTLPRLSALLRAELEKEGSR